MNIGVIGLGYWGPNLVRNVAASPATSLAAICDRDSGRLDAIGAAFPQARRTADFTELLQDPGIDAVIIATPVDTHAELGLAALAAGKHVLLEKPMASSAEEAAALVAAAEEADRTLLVDHVFLYSPAVRKIRDLTTSGRLGELRFIDSVRINLGLIQQDVNVLWDLAPHDLSIIGWVTGRRPVAVSAFGGRCSGGSVEDVAWLHVEYEGGLLATVHVSWLSPVKIRHFLVGGSERSVLYNDLDASEKVKVYDRGVDVELDPEGKREMLISYRSGDVVAPRLETREPLRSLVEHFAACAAGKEDPVSPGSQGLEVVSVIEAAQRSLNDGGRRIVL